MSSGELLHRLDEEADAEYELESEEGSILTGTIVLIGIVTMAWAAVLFSYFYLRELDLANAWRPPQLANNPPPLLGAMIGLAAVLGMIAFTYAAFAIRRGLFFEFEVGAWLAVAAGVIGAGLQVWLLTRPGFLPGTSGYTSVWTGFSILNVAFLLSPALWAEMAATRALRIRAKFQPETFIGASIMPEARIWRANTNGCLYYEWFVGAMSLLLWVVFYALR